LHARDGDRLVVKQVNKDLSELDPAAADFPAIGVLRGDAGTNEVSPGVVTK
jgi:hypothetical protein